MYITGCCLYRLPHFLHRVKYKESQLQFIFCHTQTNNSRQFKLFCIPLFKIFNFLLTVSDNISLNLISHKTKLVGVVVMLQACIWEVLCSILSQDTIRDPEIYRGFPQSLQVNSGTELPFGHNSFHLISFQVIIYQPSYYSMVYICTLTAS